MSNLIFKFVPVRPVHQAARNAIVLSISVSLLVLFGGMNSVDGQTADPAQTTHPTRNPSQQEKPVASRSLPSPKKISKNNGGEKSEVKNGSKSPAQVMDVIVYQDAGESKQQNSTKAKDNQVQRVIIHEHRKDANGRVNQIWQQQVILRSQGNQTEYRFEQDSDQRRIGPLPNPVHMQNGDLKGEFKNEFRGEITGEVMPVNGAFWLGVDCQPTSGLIREQFSLDSGLAVLSVVPQGPVDGVVQPHDIIVRFNDQKLNSVDDLVASIQKSKGEDVELQIVRKAATLKVKVAAKKRPAMQMTFAPIVLQTKTDNTIDSQQLKEFEAVVQVQKTADELPQLFVLRPGIQVGSSTVFRTQVDPNSFTKDGFHEIPGVELENVRFGISSGARTQTRIRVDSRLRGISDFKLVKPMWTTEWLDETHVKDFEQFASELHQYKTRIRNLVIRLENEHLRSKKLLARLSKKESGTPPEVVKHLATRCDDLESQLNLRQIDLKRVTAICETVQKDLTEKK